MTDSTLLRRAHPLAQAEAQRARLAEVLLQPTFDDAMGSVDLFPLTRRAIDVLQINVGRRCNQTCAHCHVDAGPGRPEVMDDRVVEACLALLEEGSIRTLDITGGAPELHPRFRDIVRRASGPEREVIHRCNLTAILLPAYSDIPALLADHGVTVVASLPCYTAGNTDEQRGAGVFEDSLRALRRLNALGYGRDPALRLDLVMNPVGASLPGDQQRLEHDYRRVLGTEHGVVFDRLLTITNMPISRFLEFLEDRGDLDRYVQMLAAAFNPAAATEVMCRSMLSVDHEGRLFDCDFNQMLEIAIPNAAGPLRVFDAPPTELLAVLARRSIAVGPHCFGCTAGSGSSCRGAIAG